MPKLKTHKGMKKRFKVTATGKVTHKKCGSSHLMSHKSGKQVRSLRKKKVLKVLAEARRIRRAVRQIPGSNPTAIEAIRRFTGVETDAIDVEAAQNPAILPAEA
jgi:large subunit ribosomal protein L35